VNHKYEEKKSSSLSNNYTTGETPGYRVGDRRGYGRNEVEFRADGKWHPLSSDFFWHHTD